MNAMKMLGIVLLVGGILGLIYGGFTYTKETHEDQDRTDRAVGQGQGNGERSHLGRRRRDRDRRTAAGVRKPEGLLVRCSWFRRDAHVDAVFVAIVHEQHDVACLCDAVDGHG